MPRGDSAGGEGSTVKLETPPSLKEWALALKGAQDISINTRNLSCWGWGTCPERNGRAFHELKAQAVSHSPHFIDPNPQPRVTQPSNEGESLKSPLSACPGGLAACLSGVVRLVSSQSRLVPSWRLVLGCQGQGRGSLLSWGWEPVEELSSDVESHLSGGRLSASVRRD